MSTPRPAPEEAAAMQERAWLDNDLHPCELKALARRAAWHEIGLTREQFMALAATQSTSAADREG